MLLDVVRAEDRRTALVGSDRGGEARGERAGARRRVAEHAAERALAREADDDRPPERDDRLEARDQLEVLRDGLA